MNFSLLKVENPNKLKSLSKNKINFFKKVEDVSLFHFNTIDNDLFHAVFNISDEYQVSTKKLGSQHNYIYSSLVNFFFLQQTNFAFLEYVNSEYQDEVLSEIRNRTKVHISEYELNNKQITLIIDKLEGNIKKVKYITEDEEFKDLDFISKEKLLSISQSNKIEEVTILLENQFITITNNGRISVDNSEEEFLVKFTKRILNAII
jgi:hypothetical protein